MLQLKPKIFRFDSFADFSVFFKAGAGDLVLTNEFLHDSFLKPAAAGADFLFQEKYGAGEPSDSMIDEIRGEMKGKDYRRVIAVGGGSVIDIAKLLVLDAECSTLDLFERRAPLEKKRELIIIPTTCGTGSEVTNISIAEIKSKNTKMGLADDVLLADYAVLIPELVRGLPYRFFITSSIDALIHAIESYVSPKSNPYTELFSVKAIELILGGYTDLSENGPEYRLEIIEDFMTGSNFAGIAFGNTGVGAVHALSYPLGAACHVPHGEANYQFFTEVFRAYSRRNPEGKIKSLNSILAGILGVPEESDIYAELSRLLDRLLPRKPLKEYGMKEADIELYTDNVIKTQQRLLANNYADLSREEIRDIYKALY
ncbi:MAG: 4-hydroxybutyrate dehydrogenase [Firmicutes bacterium]|nr:4-hydroxybutyrate dehydrogenase [Bacillota bacterium]